MIRIITDTSSDLSHKRCRELNVEMIPLGVNFEERSYKSLIDLSNRDFYEKLSQAKVLPTTSQITPDELVQVFTEYAAQGDDVIGLFISSKMSGTYLNALKAKDIVGADNIYIVDTLTVTFALAQLVEEAVVMRNKGTMTAAQIAKRMEELVPRSKLLAVVQDLNYLKMGGRLSPTSAFFASILGICPVITIQDGLVNVVGKARGKKAGYELIRKHLLLQEISGDYCVTVGNSNAPELMEDFKDAFSKELKRHIVYTCEIGSIVGTHVGPNACGLAYIVK